MTSLCIFQTSITPVENIQQHLFNTNSCFRIQTRTLAPHPLVKDKTSDEDQMVSFSWCVKVQTHWKVFLMMSSIPQLLSVHVQQDSAQWVHVWCRQDSPTSRHSDHWSMILNLCRSCSEEPNTLTLQWNMTVCESSRTFGSQLCRHVAIEQHVYTARITVCF